MISLSEDLYASYPRHIGRGAALKAIEKALKKVPYGRLSAALQAYCRKVEAERTEDQFIPHPATWFNQERYDDDMTPHPRAQAQLDKPRCPECDWPLDAFGCCCIHGKIKAKTF
jgi:hypothetical protein